MQVGWGKGEVYGAEPVIEEGADLEKALVVAGGFSDEAGCSGCIGSLYVFG